MIFDFAAHCLPKKVFEADGAPNTPLGLSGHLSVVLVSSGSYSFFEDKNLRFAGAGSFILANGTLEVSLIESGHIAALSLCGLAADEVRQKLGEPLLIDSGFAPGAAESLLMLCENPSLPESEKSAAAYSILCRLCQAQSEHASLPQLVQAAMAHIAEHYAEVYGVEELAAALGVSKSHLVRLFALHTGQTPGRYLTNIRIEAAKRLLLYRDYSLDIVASLCGFSGANYLCKVFKNATGISPSAWRKKHAEQKPSGSKARTDDGEQQEKGAEWEEMLYL